jgi:repressor LexA
MVPVDASLTRRQRDVVEFFAQFVQAEGISPTLEEIAAHFGVNKVTVFGHIEELERKGVMRRRGRGVSRALELVDSSSVRRPAAPVLPILGTIAAGVPIEEIEDRETLDLSSLIPNGAEVFALRVAGNSMIEDAIADGDIVLVERRDSARNGETVVAVLPEGEVTLKRFYKERDRIRLQPANSTMEPIYTHDVQIRGVVVGVVRRY